MFFFTTFANHTILLYILYSIYSRIDYRMLRQKLQMTGRVKLFFAVLQDVL